MRPKSRKSWDQSTRAESRKHIERRGHKFKPIHCVFGEGYEDEDGRGTHSERERQRPMSLTVRIAHTTECSVIPSGAEVARDRAESQIPTQEAMTRTVALLEKHAKT